MVRFRKNRILEKNRQGKKGLGCAMTFPSAEVVELIGLNGGFDYINLDGEHGAFSIESVDAMCRLADAFDLTVTARVPSIDSSTINSYMDRGVMGITGPHIDTPEQARALADACRFVPDGHRSWGGGRGNYYNEASILGIDGTERTEYMVKTNGEVLVMAQLETVTAFENLEGILEEDGIDAFSGGPNDLAQSMGFPGQMDHPEPVKAAREVGERIHAVGRKLSSDLMTTIDVREMILGGARSFLAENRQ